jgi:hypothetical protein
VTVSVECRTKECTVDWRSTTSCTFLYVEYEEWLGGVGRAKYCIVAMLALYMLRPFLKKVQRTAPKGQEKKKQGALTLGHSLHTGLHPLSYRPVFFQVMLSLPSSLLSQYIFPSSSFGVPFANPTPTLPSLGDQVEAHTLSSSPLSPHTL